MDKSIKELGKSMQVNLVWFWPVQRDSATGHWRHGQTIVGNNEQALQYLINLEQLTK